jgi:hypothetical protein
MYSREESSQMRQEFWTTFGKYMGPIPSAEGLKINWINYRTGIKDVYFRMETFGNSASIYISLEQKDPGIRELFFEQFVELKMMLENALEEEWIWEPARIIKELPNISVLNKDQWPELITFFKPRIIALDSFWENAKYNFESLK